MVGLIEILGSITEKDVLRLVGMAQREKGMSFHRNQFIDDLRWIEPDRILAARVNNVEARLEAKDGAIHFASDSDYSIRTGLPCAHAAGLLFTACNLVNPKRFTSLMWSNRKRENLVAAFRTEAVRDQLVEQVNRKPGLLLRRAMNGEPVAEEQAIPALLRSPGLETLLYYSWGWNEEHSQTVLEEVEKGVLDVRILTEAGERRVNSAIGPVSLSVQLNLDDGEVELAWIARKVNGEKVEKVGEKDGEEAGEILREAVVPVGEHLLFFPQSGVLGQLERGSLPGRGDSDETPEEVFAALQTQVVAAREFHQLGATVRAHVENGGHVSYQVQGQDVAPTQESATVLFELMPSTLAGSLAVRPVQVLGEQEVPMYEEVRRQELSYRSGKYPPHMTRAKMRREFLSRAFYLQARLPKDQRSTFRTECSLQEMMATQFLENDVLFYLEEGERFLETQTTFTVPVPGQGWTQMGLAPEKLAAGIGVFFDQFGCETDVLADGFLIPESEALARLAGVQRELNELGAEVTYKGASIRTVSLDVELAVEAGEQIDWFELVPEIKANGAAVPEDIWQRILAREGLVESDGELLLLDTESSGMMDLLGQFFDDFDGRKGKKKTDEPGVNIPRLAILDLMLMEAKGLKLRVPPSMREVMDSLLQGVGTREIPPPPSLKAELRDYQQTGFEWLAFLYEHRFGACLADDMGLGKTVQAIALLAGLKDGTLPPVAEREKTGPHLIVVPPSLLFNWAAEFARFAPELNVHEYAGSKRRWPGAKTDVIITTYDLVRRDLKTFLERNFHVVVFDEAQAVKNLAAARTKAVRQLQARFKLCITGTPVENHAGEYFSILDLALPGLLGTERNFRLAVEREGSESRVLKRARLFVLRRTKEKIRAELPPKVEMQTPLDLTEKQKQFYTRMVSEIRSEVSEAFAERPEQQAGIIALTALLRLRQICVTPALLDPDYDEVSPKLSYLSMKLREVADEGHAALVFSQFTRTLDVLEKTLKEEGIDFVRLDGKTSVGKRKERIASFMADDGPPVFLVSLKAGGVGLNLTRASYVFHVDPWWNPAVERQATDRAHRIGQQRTVFVNRLIMRHSIEEKMMILKERKQALYERLLAGGEGEGEGGKGGGISRADLDFLLDTLPAEEEAGE